MTHDELERAAVRHWIALVNQHWERLGGTLNNDVKFWQECLHNVPPDVWQSWFNWSEQLSELYPREWSSLRNIDSDSHIILRRIQDGKPITKHMRKDYNLPAFRLLMNIKDFLNKTKLTHTTYENLFE